MENGSPLFTSQSRVLVFVRNIRFLPIARVCSLCPPPPCLRVQPEAGPGKGDPPENSTRLCCLCGQIPGTTAALVRNWKRPSEEGQGPSTEPQPRARAFLAEVKQMRARRKTAKMLMVVLLVFALCYLPISVLNVLKR